MAIDRKTTISLGLSALILALVIFEIAKGWL
jgi:hypothetical protein